MSSSCKGSVKDSSKTTNQLSQATAALTPRRTSAPESSDVVIDEANCPKLDSHKESKVGISTSVRDRRNSHNSLSSLNLRRSQLKKWKRVQQNRIRRKSERKERDLFRRKRQHSWSGYAPRLPDNSNLQEFGINLPEFQWAPGDDPLYKQAAVQLGGGSRSSGATSSSIRKRQSVRGNKELSPRLTIRGKKNRHSAPPYLTISRSVTIVMGDSAVSPETDFSCAANTRMTASSSDRQLIAQWQTAGDPPRTRMIKRGSRPSFSRRTGNHSTSSRTSFSGVEQNSAVMHVSCTVAQDEASSVQLRQDPSHGSLVCVECGMRFENIKSLQTHVENKITWTNRSLLGSRLCHVGAQSVVRRDCNAVRYCLR